MNLTVTATITEPPPERLVLVLRLRPNAQEKIEELQKLFGEAPLEDEVSWALRKWADKTLSSFPQNPELAGDYLVERVEELRRTLLFDPLECGPLAGEVVVVAPGLITARRVLDDWKSAASAAGEAFPIDESCVKVHALASAILSWAKSICPEVESRGSLRRVTAYPKIKHHLYLARVKDAEALRIQRLTQTACEEQAERLLTGAAEWQRIAAAVEAERVQAAEAHQRQIESDVAQLTASQGRVEELVQAEVGDQELRAATLEERLKASCEEAVTNGQKIDALKLRLQSLS